MYALLQEHVASTHIGRVIEIVMELCALKPNRVPSKSTVNTMNKDRLVLAQKQIASLANEKKNLTMHSDETTKNSKKYIGFEFTDEEGGQYILGLRQLLTKSVQDTFDSFQTCLNDIKSRVNDPTTPDASLVLRSNMQNTMSDSAAVEKKFNRMVEDYRADILPLVVENYNELPDEDRELVPKVNNFYCGLHGIVHTTDGCKAETLEVEMQHFGDNIPIYDAAYVKSKEPGTFRLIRNVCKVFAYCGNNSYGVHGSFMIYLRVNNILTEHSLTILPLTKQLSHRFNIVLHNASVIYLLHPVMTDFLEKNGTCQWVLFDLKEPFFIAGCKALSLVNKLITGPLWVLMERKDIHIMELKDFALRLVKCLEDAALNVRDFMEGKLTL